MGRCENRERMAKKCFPTVEMVGIHVSLNFCLIGDKGVGVEKTSGSFDWLYCSRRTVPLNTDWFLFITCAVPLGQKLS